MKALWQNSTDGETMKRCVVICGADIGNYNRIKSFLSDDDYYIYCDSGLKHLEKLEHKPDLIVGDFDSHSNPQMDVDTIVLPRAKDDTDSVFGAREGVRRGFEDFIIIGCVGGRMDHTLNNVYLLQFLRAQGKNGVLIDDYSEMEIVADKPVYVDDSYPYFSLINICGTAKGISIKNAAFPLENAEITPDYQFGISNEVAPGKRAEISVKEGSLLLIKIIKGQVF